MFQRAILLAAVLNVAVSEPTKSPSTGMHKPTWKPSSKPAEHRQLAGSPTKSPSTGMHKPTWKPSSKPAEHRSLSTRDERAEQKAKAEADEAREEAAASTDSTKSEKSEKLEKTEVVEEEVLPKKSALKSEVEVLSKKAALKDLKTEAKTAKSAIKTADTTIDKKEAKFEVEQAEAITREIKSGSATLVVDPRIAALQANKAASQTKKFMLYKEEMANPMRRKLAGSPTKSPSTGMHKPTWKPSSKPAEHRQLAGSPTKSPSTGMHKPTWKPSSKPAEHRRLAGSPTKSPSTGMHKPTWKPSSKPAEHRELKQDFLQTTAILKTPEESLSPENLEDTKVHAANAATISALPDKAAVTSAKPVLADQQAETVYASLTKKGVGSALYATGGKVMTSGAPKSASNPTKSPSTGMHKPTWRPSSKPAEHRKLSIRSEKAAALKSATSEDKIVIKAMKSEIKEEKKEIKDADSKEERKEIKTAIKDDKKAIKTDKSIIKTSSVAQALESDIAMLEKDIKTKSVTVGLNIEDAAVSVKDIKNVDQTAEEVKSSNEEKKALTPPPAATSKTSKKATSSKKSLRRAV